MDRSGPWYARGLTPGVAIVGIAGGILIFGLVIIILVRASHSLSNDIGRDIATSEQLSQFVTSHPPPKEKGGIQSLVATREGLGLLRSVPDKNRYSGGVREVSIWLVVTCTQYSLLQVGDHVVVDGEERNLTPQDIRNYYGVSRLIEREKGFANMCSPIPDDPPLPVADNPRKGFPLWLPIAAVFWVLGLIVFWRGMKEQKRRV